MKNCRLAEAIFAWMKSNLAYSGDWPSWTALAPPPVFLYPSGPRKAEQVRNPGALPSCACPGQKGTVAKVAYRKFYLYVFLAAVM